MTGPTGRLLKHEQFSWDDTNTAETLRRWNDGESATTIGASLGTSRNSVIGKIHRTVGRQSRPVKVPQIGRWTDAQVERLMKMPSICTLEEAALKLGKPTTKVYSKAKKLGILPFVQPDRIVIAPSVSSRLSQPKTAPIIREPGPLDGVTIMELRWPTPSRGATCRWPIGGSGADMKYCGAGCGGKVYCKAHRKVAYDPRTPAQNRASTRGALWVANR